MEGVGYWRDLPHELQELIWIELPALSLFRCLLVCKSWTHAPCFAANSSFWRAYFFRCALNLACSRSLILRSLREYGDGKKDTPASWKELLRTTAVEEPPEEEIEVRFMWYAQSDRKKKLPIVVDATSVIQGV